MPDKGDENHDQDEDLLEVSEHPGYKGTNMTASTKEAGASTITSDVNMGATKKQVPQLKAQTTRQEEVVAQGAMPNPKSARDPTEMPTRRSGMSDNLIPVAGLVIIITMLLSR